MITNAKNEDKEYDFSKVNNRNESYCPLFDSPKNFLIKSRGFIYITDNELEESFTNNSIISNFINDFNIDIPETINLTDKRSSFIGTNTNTSQLFFSFEKIENILKENNYYNIYSSITQKLKEKSEIKEIN